MRVLVLLALVLSPAGLAGQEWNAPPTLDLVRRAVLAHTGEPAGQPFRARARGLVTFHVETGADGAPATRLLRADEIDLEIRKSGKGPSRQVIRAWRDSTFFPTATNYHRDHLGVVTDDFGPRIRLGDGDEVAEVPHPLSEAGDEIYEFRVRDTVRLKTPAGDLVVVTVQVRPRDGAIPAVVGTLDLEARTAALVRSQFTFTGAAYRDADLEDISVRLERTLIDGRLWLPFRQEIEIRRRSAVIDTPLRGVIRGRWEISDYDLEPVFLPDDFAGAAIGGLRRPGGPPIWTNSLLLALDSLPRLAGDADLERVRREAIGVARARWLDGLPAVRPALSRFSDALRVNRVQGLVLGAGIAWRPAPGFRAHVRADLGTADGRMTGAAELVAGSAGGRWSVTASRRVDDVMNIPVVSGIVGSLAAQEGGRDYGDYVLLERVALGWERVAAGAEMGLALAREWAWSVEAAARPSRGSYRANAALGTGPYWVAAGRLAARAAALGGAGMEGRLAAEVGTGPTSYARLLADGSVSRQSAGGDGSARLLIASGSAGLPARRSFAIGGRATLPGEPFRAWGGRHVVFTRFEWLGRLPGIGLPLGSYGRTAAESRVGPFVALGWAGGNLADAPWTASVGVRSTVGIAVELLSRAVRVEIGRSLRGGGSFGVTFDVSREWWPIL